MTPPRPSPDREALLRLIRERVSIETFDPDRPLTDDEIRALVDDAIHAPSSFNMQHWRFVAVRRPEDKEALAEAAYGQRQVADAAVTFILLGDLRAADDLDATLRPAVESGALPAGKADAWVRMAGRAYADPQLARDEAIRSCSLAAMTLMLAAEARGLCSGALTGFDPEKVRARFGIGERFLPVMLLAVGHPAQAAAAEERKTRLPVEAVLTFDRFDDPA